MTDEDEKLVEELNRRAQYSVRFGPLLRQAALRITALKGELNTSERHELECLRHQVGQLEYPCSPHCEGYLRAEAEAKAALITKAETEGEG